ncbi:hypothetical protein BGW80DRAFT_797796 [Lactifluus volemus]|nr:hypothetical protein BGW80DRAFT_797796 [Lactifluus volemus]
MIISCPSRISSVTLPPSLIRSPFFTMGPDVLAITTNISPSQSSINVAACVRVVAMSIAVYDYLLTLPFEYRLYKLTQRISLGLILFILIRYVSAVLVVTSDVGFFYPHFTAQSCAKYVYVNPALREIQMMVSQAILGIMTYFIALRNVWVGRTISLAYLATIGFQWVCYLLYRYPAMISTSANGQGDCIVLTSHPKSPISVWSMFLVAMMYDCLVLSIAAYHLLKMKVPGMSFTSKLCNILIYDGLAYIVALTAVNAVNLVSYRGASGTIQSVSAPVGFVATWIMTQRFLIHPREATTNHSHVVEVTRPTLRVNPLATERRMVEHGADEACTSELGKSTQSDIEKSETVDTYPV